jgi:hypothetical protein
MPSAVCNQSQRSLCAVLPGTRCLLSDHDFSERFVVIASENVVNSTLRRSIAAEKRQLQGLHPVEDPHAGVVRPASAWNRLSS